MELRNRSKTRRSEGVQGQGPGGPLNLWWAPDVGEGAGSGVREDKGRERRDERRERL